MSSNTSSIADMIHSKIINVGDSIEFKFKGNHFVASIEKGGLITNCLFKSPTSSKYIEVLKNVVAFTSLTAWTEASLQDVLEEYYTRYSSWKRVVHKPSKLTMGELRDRCKLSTTRIDPEIHKEIYRLQKYIYKLERFITNNGFKVPKKDIEVAPIKLKEGRAVIKGLKNKEAFERIQRIMINKPNHTDNELYNYIKTIN